ncbi:MAG: beta-galactosidase [Phycisphaeraceae bacterium]|nr:beta-galactosidase [Phycisphaeraceae bacterium]
MASEQTCDTSMDQRQWIDLNHDWQFHMGDVGDAASALEYDNLKPWLLPSANGLKREPSQRPMGDAPGESLACVQPNFDDTAWRTLDLPHDWGVERPFDIDLPSDAGKLHWPGVAWYRKSFEPGKEAADHCLYLQVDGAMSYATVWCNGKFVGGWPYGYNAWHLNLTDYVIAGQTNTLAIRLNNPPDSSRWYPGGGIYRYVRLLKVARTHILPWGTFITTPQIAADNATINIQTSIAGGDHHVNQLLLTTQIFNTNDQDQPMGVALATQVSDQWSTNAFDQTANTMLLTLPDPKRWDVTDPHRYVAVSTLMLDGKAVDQTITPFGVREIAFAADDGFHLNGKRVQIKGVCQHHDLGALGAAFNVRACERQLQMLMDMGVNAIRCAHNPPARQMLDLCDRMGLLVIDECTDTWLLPKKPNGYGRLFEDWAEADMRAMIRRDRNHPCIILWSTGNEVIEQGKPEYHHLSDKLSAIVRDEDATRLPTVGCNVPEADSNGFQKTVDVFGYNYKPHKYAPFHADNPATPVIGSETASTVSSRGEYAFPVSDEKDKGMIGFHVSSYDLYAPAWAYPPDREFEALEKNRHVAGEFVWTGFDYIGEPTPFNNDLSVLINFHTEAEREAAQGQLDKLGHVKVPSRSSYFGIIDLAGFKKDRFYLYQSHWRPELPMAHILPHWNWPDRVGQVTPVHVYTSGDEAELFLNGKSLGRKQRSIYQYRFRWDDVVYEPGTLEVFTYKSGKPWAKATCPTTGPVVGIKLQADRQVITADGEDLSFVIASLVDEQGDVVPTANHQITFEVRGAGKLRATDNGDPTDLSGLTLPTRKAFHGLALAIVQSSRLESGEITLHAKVDRLPTQSIVIESK